MSSPQNSWARYDIEEAKKQRDNATDQGLMGAATITALLSITEALLAIEERLTEIILGMDWREP